MQRMKVGSHRQNLKGVNVRAALCRSGAGPSAGAALRVLPVAAAVSVPRGERSCVTQL